jgi:hypothetical protein
MTLLLSDMRTVRLQSLTFRITQSYDLRVSDLMMHPSVRKGNYSPRVGWSRAGCLAGG